MTESRDVKFMELALEQAKQALIMGNLPIGAVIVHKEKVISEAFNLVDSEGSDLNHAEILAIRKVENFLFRHKKECEIYSTVEPCLMCIGAIYHFHFKRVVFAAKDSNAGYTFRCEHLPPSFVRRTTEIGESVMANESVNLLNEYVQKTGLRKHLLGSWI